MKSISRTLLAASLLAICLSSCNITSGSSVLVGNQRPPVDPSQVRIFIHPPSSYEEIAILSASSKNAFASDQSLTDSTIARMKKEAAKHGANGVLLTGLGSQQIGSIGNVFGNSSTYANASASAYRFGNTVTAYGTGYADTFGTATMINTPIFAKVSGGIAIYVKKE